MRIVRIVSILLALVAAGAIVTVPDASGRVVGQVAVATATPVLRTTPDSPHFVPIGPTAGWRLVRTWSGSGAYESEPFDVTAAEWRLTWQAQQTLATEAGNLPVGGVIQIEVYRRDPTGGVLLTTVVDSAHTLNSRSFQAEPGQYYLHVFAPNLEWTVTAQEPGR